MAQVQGTTTARMLEASRRSIAAMVVLALILIALVAAILLFTGSSSTSSLRRPGTVGSQEWTAFRAGERGPVLAPDGAIIEMGPRARAADELSKAGIHGSLAGTPAAGAGAVASGVDSLVSREAIDLRRCERDGC